MVQQTDIDAWNRDRSPFATAKDGFAKRMRTIGAQKCGLLGTVEHGIEAASGVRFRTHGVDAAIRAATAGHCKQGFIYIFALKVDYVGLAVFLSHLQPF